MMADGYSTRMPSSKGETVKHDLTNGALVGLVQHLPEKPTEDLECFGRPGAQLDDKVEFKNRFGEYVSATPVIIDFQRVLQLGQVNESNGVITGVSNRDLLHAVVALYDISLGDMDTETLYTTVCSKWARTIVLLQDVKDTVDQMTERNVQRRRRKAEGKECSDNEEKIPDLDWANRLDDESDLLKEEEATSSAFAEVFSDTEEDEEEEEGEEEEEEEENFSKGIYTFITNSIDRRQQREACEGILSPSMIGIENRLVACATFEKKFVQRKDRVIHLTLISVRPRFRKYSMGRYLLSKCVSPSVVGHHEAVVVHADNSAVDFFRKFGFSDDTILNSKWSELADAFTNCTLMSFFPAFSGHSLLHTNVTKDKDPDLYEIDQELKIWQLKSREAYQGQLCCVMKLRNEILQLKNLVKTQNELLNKLVSDTDRVRKEKLLVENDLLKCQMDAARSAFSEATAVPEEDSEDINTHDLIQQLEDQVSSIRMEAPKAPATPSTPSVQKSPESFSPLPTSSASDIISRFTEGMEMDRSVQVRYTVTSILKASVSPSLRRTFDLSLEMMEDPTMVTELYYCGSLEKPARLSHILKDGFSEEDFTHGEFGRGLYFSKYPSKAAQFSALGKLLEVHVGLGKVETVMRYDRTRKSPSTGHNSIISPGRLYRPGDQGEVAMLSQEYVLFHPGQALPICLIHYSAYPGS